MPVKLDTTVTVMDMVAITGVVISGLFFVFGYGGDIETNTKEIEHVQADIARIESDSDVHEEKMVNLLESVREDAKDNFEKVDGKLDKLIERELNGR